MKVMHDYLRAPRSFGTVDITKHELQDVNIVGAVMISFAWATFLPRIYTRARITRDFWWDDWSMVVTILLFTGYYVEVYLGSQEIYQYMDGALSHLEPATWRIRDSGIFYPLTSSGIKISVLFYLFRFHLQRMQRVALSIITIVYVIIAITTFGVTIGQCRSVNNFSVLIDAILQDKCMPWGTLAPLLYVSAVLNSVADWVFVLLPIQLIISSTMDRHSKLAASALIILGTGGGICSVVRICYVSGLNVRVSPFPHKGIGSASMAELGICIITPCLATLRPLYLACRNRFLPDPSSRADREGASHAGAAGAILSPGLVGKDGEVSDLVDAHKVEGIKGVGVLHSFGLNTGMSTVTSAIFRRIRNEDFAVFGGSFLDPRKDTATVDDGLETGDPNGTKAQRPSWTAPNSGGPLKEDDVESGSSSDVISTTPEDDDTAGEMRQQVKQNEHGVMNPRDQRRRLSSHRLSVRSFEIS